MFSNSENKRTRPKIRTRNRLETKSHPKENQSNDIEIEKTNAGKLALPESPRIILPAQNCCTFNEICLIMQIFN